MKISWLVSATPIGLALMFAGILLTNVNMRLPVVNALAPDSSISQLIVAILLIGIGFALFTKQINKMPRLRDMRYKSKNELLEIFGF